MADGFQQGTWNALPDNCTRSFTLTWFRCAEYGLVALTECLTWAVTTEQKCIEWTWQETKKCSWWSWIFCVLWSIIVTLVCVAFGIVTSIVCTLLVVVEVIVCVLWTVISIIFCLSKAKGGTAFLLTDGTVMMQEFKSFFEGTTGLTWATPRWWKLTPDSLGSYRNGSWSRLADSRVGRAGFASAVLADGRVAVCGGEYSDASGTYKNDENNTCEIYDPVTDRWSPFASPTNLASPPVTWAAIGDAPCTLLADGTLLMGSIFNTDVARLDPVTLTWTAMQRRPKVASSTEDSWVLMPDDTVVAPSCTNPPTTWVYDVATDQWNSGNDLPVSIVAVAEIGPGVLRYDGTAFFLGANLHTAVFTPGANPAWTNAPDLPAQNGGDIGIADGPAALLVNGNMLFGAGPTNAAGDANPPSYFFEFDGAAFNRTTDPPNNDCPPMFTRLLLLPDGDVLFCTQIDTSFYAYHSDAATPQDSFRPVILACPTNIQPGATIQVSGLQFNGLSQAVAYGDDSQTATNYPLVRVVNKGSGHVRYCRTFDHTRVDGNGQTVRSMGVATGAAVITTNVKIPDDIELGDSSLVVVANGIPSQPFDVAIWPIIL